MVYDIYILETFLCESHYNKTIKNKSKSHSLRNPIPYSHGNESQHDAAAGI